LDATQISQRKRRNSRKKKKKGIKIKKSSKPFKNKKKYFKKNKKTANKPAAKQIQKQDYRCWSYNEKGHYANECPKQLNFAGTYTNELFEQIAGYEAVLYSDINSEDEIIVFTYLSSSDKDESD